MSVKLTKKEERVADIARRLAEKAPDRTFALPDLVRDFYADLPAPKFPRSSMTACLTSIGLKCLVAGREGPYRISTLGRGQVGRYVWGQRSEGESADRP